MNLSTKVRWCGTSFSTDFPDRIARLLCVLAVTIAAGFADGQEASAVSEHRVSVRIEGALNIRIVGAGSPRVEFDFAADPDTYFAASAVGTPLEPTRVEGFDDLEIRTPPGVGAPAWYVTVQATPFAYIGPGDGAGLATSDIVVRRGASSGLAPTLPWFLFATIASQWRLSETATPIAYGYIGTGRWYSLGVDGTDYRLEADGDEDPGRWSTRVTYTLVAP